jgi:hypothetical protein
VEHFSFNIFKASVDQFTEKKSIMVIIILETDSDGGDDGIVMI